jgi:hypothetical protein
VTTDQQLTPLGRWLKAADAKQKALLIMLAGMERTSLYRASVLYTTREGYGRRLSHHRAERLLNAIGAVTMENAERPEGQRTAVFDLTMDMIDVGA